MSLARAGPGYGRQNRRRRQRLPWRQPARWGPAVEHCRQPADPYPVLQPHRIDSLAFSPDGKTLAVGSDNYSNDDGEVEHWNANTGQPISRNARERDDPREPQLLTVISIRHGPAHARLDLAPSTYVIARSAEVTELPICAACAMCVNIVADMHANHYMFQSHAPTLKPKSHLPQAPTRQDGMGRSTAPSLYELWD